MWRGSRRAGERLELITTTNAWARRLASIRSRAGRLPGGGWGWVALSLLAYGAIVLITGQPFHDGARSLNYFDLRIYVYGARRLLDGTSLYATTVYRHYGFTYPPFAALLFAPLAPLSLHLDEVLVTALNVALLLWLIRRTARITSARGHSRWGQRGVDAAQRWPWARAAGLAAALIWLEPISVAIGYGQVDLLIAALVVFDISRPDTARGKGIAIGLAAAVKLTPLFFIPYLLLSGRRRAAAWATGTFAATVAISYAAAGADASAYWTHRLFLNSSRIGTLYDSANQSLQGLLARLEPGHQPGMSWHLIALLVALAGLWLAVTLSRRGDEAGGFSIAALTTLLVSPISWDHHWTLAVPALLLLARRARDERSRRLTAAVVLLTLIGVAYLPERWQGHTAPTGVVSLVSADAYVLVGVAGLALTAATLVAHRRRTGPVLAAAAHA